MQINIAKITMQTLMKQRNALLVLSTLLLICNFLLVIKIVVSSDKCIILPGVTETIEYDGKNFSKSYVSRMTKFLIHYLFDLTPNNVDNYHKIVKDYSDNSLHRGIDQYFHIESKFHHSNNAISYFLLNKIEIEGYRAIITGKLFAHIGKEQVTEEEKQYSLLFSVKGGQLKLVKFDEISQ